MENVMVVMQYVKEYGLGITVDAKDCVVICDPLGAIIFKSVENKAKAFKDLREQIEEYVIDGFRIASECAYTLDVEE